MSNTNIIEPKIQLTTHRQENIDAIMSSITNDQYDDVAQFNERADMGQEYVKAAGSDDLLDFVKRNIKYPALEIGAGSGDYTIRNGIVCQYYLEPSQQRVQRLLKVLQEYNIAHCNSIAQTVIAGVMEYIPEDIIEDGSLLSIVFLNGFWQVRSDYECLIEANRKLAIDGRLIFNLAQNDNEDLICGRVIGYKNYLRILREFGFEIYEARDEGFICARKVKNFDPRDLRKLQLIRVEGSGDNATYKAANFFPDGRDATLL